MSYMTVAGITQVAALLIFVALFAAVLVYALRPRNKARFDRAAREALDLDTRGTTTGNSP